MGDSLCFNYSTITHLERGIESYHRISNPDTGIQEHYSISKDNYQTFVTTNVVPQLQKDTAWQQLEGDINRFVRNPKNPSNEVYVITGRNGSSDMIPSTLPDPDLIRERTTQFNIDVPEMLWKVVLIPEKPGQSPTDITTKAKSFGVILPNIEQDKPEKLDWCKHIVSVNKIEEDTGYNFFSNIPTEVQEQIENNETLPQFF